jgi:hypothetical protein
MFAKRHTRGNGCVEKRLLAPRRIDASAGPQKIAFGKPRERSVPRVGTMQEMKKTLLLMAVAVLILNASGCGACRNGLFARRQAAAPMMGHMQCAPMCQPACQPVCCPQPCDPCCSGNQMSVGYDGGGAMMMEGGEASGCACGM